MVIWVLRQMIIAEIQISIQRSSSGLLTTDAQDNCNSRFLAAKQLFTKSATEFKKLLKEFWFTLYSRGNRILGSRLEKSFDF